MVGRADFSETHFHIRWLPSDSLDWERFNSREDAEVRARELASPGESYVLDEFGANCERCNAMASAAGSSI